MMRQLQNCTFGRCGHVLQECVRTSFSQLMQSSFEGRHPVPRVHNGIIRMCSVSNIYVYTPEYIFVNNMCGCRFTLNVVDLHCDGNSFQSMPRSNPSFTTQAFLSFRHCCNCRYSLIKKTNRVFCSRPLRFRASLFNADLLVFLTHLFLDWLYRQLDHTNRSTHYKPLKK